MSLAGSGSGVARNDGSQKTHFIRRRLQFTDVGIASGVKIGRLPLRAYITYVDYHVVTAFNSGTSDTVQLGTTATGVDILAATSIHSTGLTHGTSAAGLGLAVTGSAEKDVFLQWVGVGAVPSAGDVTIVIGYMPDNDQ